jgi:hypothetical protein
MKEWGTEGTSRDCVVESSVRSTSNPILIKRPVYVKDKLIGSTQLIKLDKMGIR